MPVACAPPATLAGSTLMPEMVGCPVDPLTVNVREVDQALRFPARSAVRTRQKYVHRHKPPVLPTLGGMTTSAAGIAPRWRMKFRGKSERVETWNSYASTPEASLTSDHSRRPMSPLWNVAPSAGETSAGALAERSPLASASSAIFVTNPSFGAVPPMPLLDVGSAAAAVIGKSFDEVWPLTITVLPLT